MTSNDFGVPPGPLVLRLTDATPEWDATLQKRPGYVLTADPAIATTVGSSGRVSRKVFDGSFNEVRRSYCTDEKLTPCKANLTIWPDEQELRYQGHYSLLGYGLPAYFRQVTPGRDGMVHIWWDFQYDYRPPRLVPETVRGHNGTVVARLTSYTPAGPLTPIPDWPSPPDLLANTTYGFQFMPQEGKDLFGLGFTPLEALEAIKAGHPEAAAILQKGGCVAEFRLKNELPWQGVPTDGVATAWFLLQANGGSFHAYSIQHFGTGPVNAGFSRVTDERDPTLQRVSDHKCPERASGPGLHLDTKVFLGLAEAWTKGRRAFEFRASSVGDDWWPMGVGVRYWVGAVDDAAKVHGGSVLVNAERGTAIRLETLAAPP